MLVPSQHLFAHLFADMYDMVWCDGDEVTRRAAASLVAPRPLLFKRLF
jgi:hypothetical protein